MEGRTQIEAAIMAAAEAGKLRKYVRQHGETGLAGLVRLADRHSALATAALRKVAGGGATAGLARGLESPRARLRHQ